VTRRRAPQPRRARRATGEEGTGLIASLAALLVFLALLLFAVQTLVALHTRSVVTDAAYEGARAVAGARVDHTDPAAVAGAQSDASERVRRMLGRFGERVELDWSGTTSDTISLTVRARPPGFLWAALRGPGAALVDRTVHVRVEELR
jgi:Flp pilus assembly protein TadG